MINNYYGTGYSGSADLQTSVGGAEIITKKYFNLALDNVDECHVSINGGSYIYLKAGQGLLIDVCSSLKIEETSISFNWVGQEA